MNAKGGEVPVIMSKYPIEPEQPPEDEGVTSEHLRTRLLKAREILAEVNKE